MPEREQSPQPPQAGRLTRRDFLKFLLFLGGAAAFWWREKAVPFIFGSEVEAWEAIYGPKGTEFLSPEAQEILKGIWVSTGVDGRQGTALAVVEGIIRNTGVDTSAFSRKMNQFNEWLKSGGEKPLWLQRVEKLGQEFSERAGGWVEGRLANMVLLGESKYEGWAERMDAFLRGYLARVYSMAPLGFSMEKFFVNPYYINFVTAGRIYPEGDPDKFRFLGRGAVVLGPPKDFSIRPWSNSVREDSVIAWFHEMVGHNNVPAWVGPVLDMAHGGLKKWWMRWGIKWDDELIIGDEPLAIPPYITVQSALDVLRAWGAIGEYEMAAAAYLIYKLGELSTTPDATGAIIEYLKRVLDQHKSRLKELVDSRIGIFGMKRIGDLTEEKAIEVVVDWFVNKVLVPLGHGQSPYKAAMLGEPALVTNEEVKQGWGANFTLGEAGLIKEVFSIIWYDILHGFAGPLQNHFSVWERTGRRLPLNMKESLEGEGPWGRQLKKTIYRVLDFKIRLLNGNRGGYWETVQTMMAAFLDAIPVSGIGQRPQNRVLKTV